MSQSLMSAIIYDLRYFLVLLLLALNIIYISSYKKTQYYLKYIHNLFKINEAFRSFLHPQVKIMNEKSYIEIHIQR